MTYELTDEQLETVAGYRAFLSTEDSRSALDLFIEAAKTDTIYDFVPTGHGNIARTVKFQFKDAGRANQSAYAFIVNQSDLLFYYRAPSGRVSDALASQLASAGLVIKRPNTAGQLLRGCDLGGYFRHAYHRHGRMVGWRYFSLTARYLAFSCLWNIWRGGYSDAVSFICRGKDEHCRASLSIDGGDTSCFSWLVQAGIAWHVCHNWHGVSLGGDLVYCA